jgi:hypothetical protein
VRIVCQIPADNQIRKLPESESRPISRFPINFRFARQN